MDRASVLESSNPTIRVSMGITLVNPIYMKFEEFRTISILDRGARRQALFRQIAKGGLCRPEGAGRSRGAVSRRLRKSVAFALWAVDARGSRMRIPK
jgi:hypothetical protein